MCFRDSAASRRSKRGTGAQKKTRPVVLPGGSLGEAVNARTYFRKAIRGSLTIGLGHGQAFIQGREQSHFVRVTLSG